MKANRHTVTSLPLQSSYHDIILGFIKECRNEQNKDRRIEILNQINSMLLKPDQLIMPSQITNEYVEVALNKAEGTLLR